MSPNSFPRLLRAAERALRTLGVSVALGRLPALMANGVLCVLFLVLWFDPLALGRSGPTSGSAILIFEFLFLHTTALFSGREVRTRKIVGAMLYVPIVAAAALAIASPIAFLLFMWHIVTILTTDWNKAGFEREVVMGRYVFSFMIGFVLTAVVAIGAVPAPAWAYTPPGGVPWGATPEGRYDLVPALGTLYYGFRAVLDFVASPDRGETRFRSWIASMGGAVISQ